MQSDSSEIIHRLRLSIDIHSINEAQFKGLIYAYYSGINNLGIKPFKSLPAIEINNNSEELIKNSFASYTFDINKTKLFTELNQNKLKIELFHQDRLKKDLFIGQSTVDLGELLKCSIRKTNQSYVRVYDSYLPIDEIDENTQNPIKKIGSLRVIIYLEDLGPINEAKFIENDIIDLPKNNEKIEIIPETQDYNPEKVYLSDELQNIEYKIVWELENWKKNEEMRFMMNLKAKEAEFLSQLNEEIRKKEVEKEKKWRQVEGNILSIESKLKSKMTDLMKREQKLVLIEEEYKQKMQEVSRICSLKDEEILELKKKTKIDKNLFESEKNVLNNKNLELIEKYEKLNKEHNNFKKEMENSPLSLIKNDLNEKNLEIRNLQKELQKSNDLKEEYKQYYEKIREEIIQLKKEYEKLRIDQKNKTSDELERLKLQINALTLQKEKDIFSDFRSDLKQLKKKNFGNESEEEELNSKKKENPFKKSMIPNSKSNSFYDKKQQYTNYQWDKEGLSEYERLNNEKIYLLQSGDYNENDPLIKELDEAMMALKK